MIAQKFIQRQAEGYFGGLSRLSRQEPRCDRNETGRLSQLQTRHAILTLIRLNMNSIFFLNRKATTALERWGR